ncbi:MAG: murein transglycosylase domain-containing protein [Hydrogenovibrio sp.]|uniref:murein transglycosylase domain-containing protein n=1 Tax=Hydrogenovibrio sp. TaxID=2065821 RepID=UPI00286FD903|nr:murein transglycosylase domain-containing protein [Hydrogenovibrio sp.]MDR9498253.1 murein transglycosylase domain-containing protein [Hydrogenovibrio sp.]
MKRRTFLQQLLIASGVGLSGCQPHEIRRGISLAQKLENGDVGSAVASQIPGSGVAPLDQLVRKQLANLIDELAAKWGDDKVASPKEYVKYTDKYLTRAIINFESGAIRVETIDPDQSRQKLHDGIVSTLLTPENPAKVDLLSSEAIETGQTPFLKGLVRDTDNKAIWTQWRAKRYADHLLKTAYQQDRYHDKDRHFVTFHMVQNHQASQANQYADQVLRQSRRFGIPTDLTYAIIETESSFNPYAMSHIPAYGLMQIVPTSAGRDAYQLLHKEAGTPSKNYLFQPNKNIEMGTAYLHILNTRYLARVRDPQTRQYCVIAGYNTGSGNVLKAFDSNRDRAFAKINALSPDQTYQHLRQHLKYAEARNYLKKVTQVQKRYQA